MSHIQREPPKLESEWSADRPDDRPFLGIPHLKFQLANYHSQQTLLCGKF